MQLPKRFLPFYQHVLAHDDLTTELVQEPVVYCNGLPCGGVFEAETYHLRVATGRPYKVWAPIFVHEFAHYLQYQEDIPECDAMLLNGDVYVGYLADQWLAGNVELNRKQRLRYFRAMQALELDCERRTCLLLAQWKLGVDRDAYGSMANAYVLSHEVALQHRVWLRPRALTTNLRRLQELLPTYLLPQAEYWDRGRFQDAFDFLLAVCMGPITGGKVA